MSNALGEGWLIPLIVGFMAAFPVFATTVLVPAIRWATERWGRGPVSRLQVDKRDLTAGLENKSKELIEVLKENALLQIQLDRCIGEVRQWRGGRTPPEEERFRP